MNVDFENYIGNGVNAIEGWCGGALVWESLRELYRDITEKQKESHSVVEIGVHHGKFFIGLCLLCKGVNNVAIDLFDELQEYNLDNSGKGNKAIFEKNIDGYNLLTKTHCITADSTLVKSHDIKKLIISESAGIISIDGCHLYEHTLSDFKLACEVVMPYGIIILDDCFNPAFPEVTSAMYTIAKLRTIYKPFLLVDGKLMFSHIGYVRFYLRILSEYFRSRIDVLMKRIEIEKEEVLYIRKKY